jgi:chromatin segregation and condensation protein Rec8/ScpA/Scc1 (kleisin family)
MIVLDPEEVTVAEMIAYIEEQLHAMNGAVDASALLRQETGTRRSGLFLAMLEMAQTQRIDILQSDCFAPIVLLPRKS